MSGVQPALFFVSLPDLKSLCCVTLTLHDDYEEPRTKQMTTCRELVLLFSNVLAAPALDSFTEITAVMAIHFYESGLLQSFVHRHCLQMNYPEQVYPGILQSCVSFSLISRLSPNWNKAGLYLVHGQDFLSERGRLTAVNPHVCLTEAVSCVFVQLEDLGLSPLVLRRFCSDPDSVLDPHHTGGPVWCHVLPSMKKGQIITISRKLPEDGPFRSYTELQRHWNRLYGYLLPDQEEDQVVYCSVYFKLVGQNLFTYPLCCIRLSPVQRCPRVDLQGALSCFMADVREKLPSVCGFPTKISSKSSFTTAALYPASEQIPAVNLSQASTSRPVLTHLPPPPATLPRQTKLFFGSQPAPAAPLFSSAHGFSLSQPCSSNQTPLNFSDFFKPASSVNPFFTVLNLPRLLRRLFKSRASSQPQNVVVSKSINRETDRLTLQTTSNPQSSARAPVFLSGIPTQKSSVVKRIPTFSPKNKVKPALIVTPEAEMKKSKTVVKFNLEGTENTEQKSTGNGRKSVLKKKSALKVSTKDKQTKTSR
ncbi:hypothetical protein WMY93_029156 [Mugilogobius chulae]|uniref:DUF4708 domain-containing protein n=1 Tax=Mugilogobius chulae TaxID=88201 RepID=A0AAW0MQD5_9GOBI